MNISADLGDAVQQTHAGYFEQFFLSHDSSLPLGDALVSHYLSWFVS